MVLQTLAWTTVSNWLSHYKHGSTHGGIESIAYIVQLSLNLPSSIKDYNLCSYCYKANPQTDWPWSVLTGALEYLSLRLLVQIRVDVSSVIVSWKGAAFAKATLKRQDLLGLYTYVAAKVKWPLLHIYPLDHWQRPNIYKDMRWMDAYRYSSLFTYSEETSDTQLSLRIMAAIHSLSSQLRQQWDSKFVCVQETKTLYPQHKQNILRYTCVFSKTVDS